MWRPDDSRGGERLGRGQRHSGITLVQVLVVIGIIVLIVAFLIPVGHHTRGDHSKIRCASNLRQIGLGIMLYANENNGHFPRTYFDESADPVILATTMGSGPVPKSFAPAGSPSPVGDNNVCASFFLVLKTQDLTSEVFICPDSAGEHDTFKNNSAGKTEGTSNWTSIPTNLTYSYIVPFPTKRALDLGYKLNTTMSADYAIASDINPGNVGGMPQVPDSLNVKHDASRQTMMRANSKNHNGDGQNVLYADGHVEWAATPYAGMPRPGDVYRDNIFTAGASEPGTLTPNAGPQDLSDSVLLPTDDPGGL